MFLPAYSIIILFTVIIVSFTTRIDFFFGSIHLLLNNANNKDAIHSFSVFFLIAVIQKFWQHFLV